MRIAYGYLRAPQDFDAFGVDRVWIDSPATNRSERTEMLRMGLGKGDTLVLLSLGDLGKPYGKRRAAIEDMGMTVEIHEPEIRNGRPGRRPRFDPEPEADKALRAMWKAPMYHEMRDVLAEAERKTGRPVSRNQMNQRYGNRWGD